MFLSGLADSFRRLLSHVRQATIISRNREEGVESDMDVWENEWPVQRSSTAVALAVPLVGGRERERESMGIQHPVIAVLGVPRMGPTKRKLEELEVGAAEFSRSATSQVRPRREAREDLLEGIASEVSTGERFYAESFNPVQAQSLDEESRMREEAGNEASDADAMWDDYATWDFSTDGNLGDADRSRACDCGDAIREMIEDDDISNGFTSAAEDRPLGTAGGHGDHADPSIGKTSGGFPAMEPMTSLATETGSLGRIELEIATVRDSDDGESETCVLRRNELPRRDFQSESETYLDLDFSCRSMEDYHGIMEVSTSSSKNGSGASVISSLSSCKTDSFFDENLGSLGDEASFCDENLGNLGDEASFGDESLGSLGDDASQFHAEVLNDFIEVIRLQFFVRTFIDGRTIVLHANVFDTVESVLRQIFLKTGLPISEQRLIYFGRQLQHDQTLGECGVGNDATLYLVARMRSTALPRSWQLINELVATIRRTCAMGSAIENQEGHFRLRLMQAQDSIKSGVKDFLKMAMKSAPFLEHMQVFQLAGATSALIMLLLSPVESNRECAEESIRLFLCSSEECLPVHIHCHCVPVLLEFCKLLSKTAPNHSLYSVCRNALACLLDTEGVAHGSTYFNEAKAENIVHDFAPFVNELSLRLSSKLKRTAREYTLKERVSHFTTYVREVQDFTAFVIPLCKAMEVCKGIENLGSSLTVSKAKDTGNIRSFGNAAEKMDVLNAFTLNKDGSGKDRVPLMDEIVTKDTTGAEIGSQRWLRRLFQDLLQVLDICLEAVIQVANRPLEISELVVDEKPFAWAPFLVVLKGLHAIAKLYEDALGELLTMLHSRRSALNILIKHSRWQDDHFWLLEHTFLLDFESKRRLVMAMLPEPQDDHDDRQEIMVHRSHLLSESFDLLAYVPAAELQGGISVEFAAEEATGPGVLREWFSLICREIFNPQNALFLSCPNDCRRIFPNPASGVNPGHLTYFRFCGRVIALALMHKVQMDVVFALAFLKQLAGLPISWEDARDADPLLYESCRKILQMDADFVDSDVLGLTFVCDEEELGRFKTVELCPGGEDMSVNSKNRLVYVEHLVQRRLVTSVTEQVKSFSQGFSDLLANANQEQFFRALEAEDFNLMLYGSDRTICLEDWKLHTEYHEYSSSDDQIVWFWQVVESMTMMQRRKLLFFSTSVTHLPAEGFTGLSSKFHIHKAHTDISWLPTAHTCFYQLVLPVYPSFEIMHARLLAVTEVHIAEGFGFA